MLWVIWELPGIGLREVYVCPRSPDSIFLWNHASTEMMTVLALVAALLSGLWLWKWPVGSWLPQCWINADVLNIACIYILSWRCLQLTLCRNDEASFGLKDWLRETSGSISMFVRPTKNWGQLCNCDRCHKHNNRLRGSHRWMSFLPMWALVTAVKPLIHGELNSS